MSNPFIEIIDRYGKAAYERVVHEATLEHKQQIADSMPVPDLVKSIRKRALELAQDENRMMGIKLEEAMGI
ncbi:hypothetical protein [Stutzerimonas kunmingensis]|uniref:Uncharacterized protein n=1 Tax=Stutzerimonas kunmingensis TaxID=1211807 RepID=A0A9X1N4D0_9GAMM|nr:hypothetical protein [Stutzerimonas kunmingensis]MCD1608622.1 hypothetical protein [Stutzerimonas kunmingensis]